MSEQAADNLGLISRATFEQLSSDDKLNIIYDALVGKCAECTDKFEPKRGFAWKAANLTLVAACSTVGGFLAQVCGLGSKLK